MIKLSIISLTNNFVPQNAIDIELCLRITSKTPTLPLLIENYAGRSISLAAENESFNGGSLNGGVLLNVRRNARPLFEGWE